MIGCFKGRLTGILVPAKKGKDGYECWETQIHCQVVASAASSSFQSLVASSQRGRRSCAWLCAAFLQKPS